MHKLSQTVLTVTNEDLIAITDNINRPEAEIEQQIQGLQQWIQEQPHLPNDPENSHLRQMLQLNKFNMEKTKWKLDNYYSYRNYLPDFYEDRDPLSPRMQKVFDNVILVPMPKLVNNTTRICIAKLINDNPADFDCEAMFKLIFAVGDVRLHYDLALQDIFITDFGGFRWRHIFHISPSLVKRAISIIKNVFSARIAGIHILNCPSYAYALISLTKSILPTKIAKRVYMHESPDSIKDFIDVEYLPKEFGGHQESLEIIYARWREFMEEHSDWLEKESAKKSNEELRQKKNTYMNRLYNLF